MEMFQKKDKAHLKAMNEMQQLMQKPKSMSERFDSKKNEFEALPEISSLQSSTPCLTL
jgi:hypothetical protein